MKTAFSTVACMSLPWRQVLACAARHGMDEVEVRLDDAGRVFGLPDEELGEVAAILSETGVAISDLGTGIRVTGYHPDLLPQAERCITLARSLGARAIRVFPGSFVKRFSDPAPHDLPGMGRFLREVGVLGETFGVQIWIETHNEFSTGRAMAELLRETAHPGVNAIWDVIHSQEQGEAPKDTLHLLGDRIAHVHIKDGVRQQDPELIDFRYTRLGEGQLPLRDIMRLLRQAGYHGTLSLEWENAWRPEIRDCYPDLDALLTAWQNFLQAVK